MIQNDSQTTGQQPSFRDRYGRSRGDMRNLFLRNVLNGVFMIMAVLAMVGLVVYSDSPATQMWCYGLGLFAVLVKMIEVVMRMPGFHKKKE